MSLETNQAILLRLRSAGGHLQAITKMVENGTPCEKVFHQLIAVESALHAIGLLLIEEQLKLNKRIICQAESLDERSQALEQLVLLYQMMNKQF